MSRIEGIRAIGAILQLILFSLRQLLTTLILAAVIDTSGLNRDQQVFVILHIEHRHEPGMTGKHAINQQILLDVLHGRTQVDLLNHPSARHEGLADHVTEIFIVNGIVAIKRRRIMIKDDHLQALMTIVDTEVINQFIQLTLILNVEALEHQQLPITRLTGYQPVDIRIIIKGDAKSYNIAAASIIAKVCRDRLMLEYDKEYPAYDFASNKGYGTAKHIAALKEYGATPIHRRSFIKNFVQ